MKLSDFDYKYPKELIAQRPLPNREDSRMMVVRRVDESVEHRRITELPDVLGIDDLIVLNDTKVIPARLFGKRGSGEEIELLVIEPHEGLWHCLLKKAKRIRDGEKFFFGMQSTATARGRDGIFLLVEFGGNSLELAMKHHGVPPLPPYIEREGIDAYTEEDKERYQTVYAKRPGSSAAPTAGLHLSEAILHGLAGRGLQIEHVTLHVGIDTFAPVRMDDLSNHKMHGERVTISKETAEEIAKAKSGGKRVVAVGTTTVRALESWDGRPETSGSWTTDLFITPGFEFKIVDAMLTNFHLPKSTLLMMVSAFAGREFILKCYSEAISESYRLFSYGDCMLIL